jgi:hypothetical protein
MSDIHADVSIDTLWGTLWMKADERKRRACLSRGGIGSVRTMLQKLPEEVF